MKLPHKAAFNRQILMVDSTDHVTGKTGLTLTITASKDGGAFGSITPTVTELATGWYKLALTATHTDTLGAFAMHITGSGADPTDTLDQVTGEQNAAGRIYVGTVTGATPTTSTIVDSGLTQTFTNFWAGRIIIFTSGNLASCASEITGFDPATDTLTFVAMPSASAQNDTYIIV